jgi:hypothetical protein
MASDRTQGHPLTPWRARGRASLLSRTGAARVVSAVAGLAIALSLSTGCAHGGESAVFDEVFLGAGLDAHVRGLGEAVEAAAARQAGDLAPEAGRGLCARAAHAADRGALLAAARAAFARGADPRVAARARSFLGSPLGRSLRDMEARAETGIDDATLSAFVDALFREPVALDRVRLLDRLAVATRGAELAAEIDAIAARVVVRAASAQRAGPDTASALAQADARIEAARTRAIAAWRSQSSVFLQLVYRDAREEDLAAYAAFAESAEGRWLVDATARMLAALEPWLAGRMAARAGPAAPAPDPLSATDAPPALRGCGASPS